MLEEELVLL
jgi:hypothetical protein